jgi:lipopolysaccharide/colanic/teichoic acid biosynthesis glycosyltransferase
LSNFFDRENHYMSFYEKDIKRVFDVFLCTIALIVLSPIFLITAIAIKLSSKGPIFYYSVRAGKNKKPFNFYKFRSMHMVDENHKQKDLYIADEDRLFAVGRIIRRLKIDELPQIINVIKGDMSIVGPRPVPMSSVDWQYCGRYEKILSVRPGLTSAASLYDYTVGDACTDEEEYRKIVVPNKFEMELLYIDKQSFRYDMQLVLRTMLTILMVFLRCKALPKQPELQEIRVTVESGENK